MLSFRDSNKRARFSCSFAHRTPPPSTITDNKEMWIAQFHLPVHRLHSPSQMITKRSGWAQFHSPYALASCSYAQPPLPTVTDNKENVESPVSLTASAGCETLSWRALLEMDGWRMSVSSEAVSLIPHILGKKRSFTTRPTKL